MKTYGYHHPEEKETYRQYMDRKSDGWKRRVEEYRSIASEIRGSSLKEEDKISVAKKLGINIYPKKQVIH